MKIPSSAKDMTYSPESSVREDKPSTGPDFSEYMWMENEEEFDKEVMKQLEEEALMEQCIEAMLEDELESKNPLDAANFINDFEKLGMQEKADIAKKSTLNPDAAEFIPRSTIAESS
uniref:Unkown protein n=1 Tax=Riptortus pedestris TaxID=329032 RepID=R4WD64_RIPPE|nr:unkown protein [Riptortus pedestris]